MLWISTVTGTVLDTAAVLLASPEYCTVRLLLPAARLLVVRLAKPLTTVAVPSTMVPS